MKNKLYDETVENLLFCTYNYYIFEKHVNKVKLLIPFNEIIDYHILIISFVHCSGFIRLTRFIRSVLLGFV